MPWWGYALLSALAASATAVLSKLGVQGIPSNLATAIRTTVVLVIAWVMVVALGEERQLASIGRKPLLWLALSGVGTGLSWLAYFKALQMAPASRVAPIDKLSLALTVLLAFLILGEKISWKLGLGVALMIAGALLTLAG